MAGSDLKFKYYNDFRGGWNADAAPDNLLDNECEVLENYDLSFRGALSQRAGTVPMNSAAFAADVEEIIEWPRSDGTVVLLLIIGNNLCRVDETHWTVTTIQALDNPTIGWFIFKDKFYFTGKASTIDHYWVYDGTTVADVVASEETGNDLGPIKRCRSFIWNHRNFRVYGTKDPNDLDAVYYSEANDPTYFKSTNMITPTTGDGNVLGLGLFSEGLIVAYPNSLWCWTGTDPSSDATWEKLPLTHGVVSGRSIVPASNTLSMVGIGGIYTLSPSALDKDLMMISTDELSTNITLNKVASVIQSAAHPQTIISLYDSLHERLLVAYGDDPDNPKNNAILVYDWTLKAFTKYTFTSLPITHIMARTNGDIYIASNKYVVKLGEGLNDWDSANGAYVPIYGKWWSKEWVLDLENPMHIKKTKRMYMGMMQYGTTDTTLDVGIKASYKSLLFEDALMDESLAWGEEWGRIWGWTDVMTKEFRCRMKGSRFQVRVDHNKLNEACTIFGTAFSYKLKKPKGVRVNVTPKKNVLS